MHEKISASTFSFCPVLNDLLCQERAVGRNGKVFENLSALSSRNNLATIHRLMLHFSPVHTLEIGLGLGGSALVFCSSHKELGHQPNHQHVAIDPFQTTVWDSCGLLMLERAGLSNFIDFQPQVSSVALPTIMKSQRCFGFIYVDGSHLFEDVFCDSYYAIRLLKLGGVIAFDDSTNPHIAKVLNFLRTSINEGLEEMDLARFRERPGGLSYRVARQFGKVQLTAFRRIGEVSRVWNAPYHPF